MPSLDGRTVVVTGANSGVGFGTSTILARAGAHVVLAVRDLDRGADAARRIDGSTEVRRLDLADLSSVREFARRFEGEISILINNAGVAMVPRGRTRDGFEMQFGTNHLGHFALTNLLLPRITDRVVTVSSDAHRIGRIDFDDLDYARSGYGPVKAYARSKLANLLFTLELDRRLRETGSAVQATAAYPGYADSNIGTADRNRYLVSLVHLAGRYLAQSPEQAALPSLYAATQDIPGGSYIGPDGVGGMWGYPTRISRSARAGDAASAQQLWQVSEDLTSVRFDPESVGRRS